MNELILTIGVISCFYGGIRSPGTFFWTDGFVLDLFHDFAKVLTLLTILEIVAEVAWLKVRL